MADVEKINGYDIADALALRKKSTSGTNSFVDARAGTTTYSTENVSESIIIGDKAYTTSTGNSDNVIIGNGAHTASASVTVLGRNASVNTGAGGSVAIGSSATVLSGLFAISIGASSNAYANNSIAIGGEARTTGTSSIAIGARANATGAGNIVIGSGTSTGTNGLFFGSYKYADLYNGILDYHRFADSTPTNGQVIIYDSANDKVTWGTISTSSSVSTLTDVQLTNLTDGQTLVYNASSSKWVNGTGGVSASYDANTKTITFA